MNKLFLSLKQHLNNTTDEEYEKGLEIVISEQIKINDLRYNETFLKSSCIIENKEIKLFYDNYQNLNYECECDFYKNKMGYCAHFVSLVLYMEKHIKNNNYENSIFSKLDLSDYNKKAINLIKTNENKTEITFENTTNEKNNLINCLITNKENKYILKSFEMIKISNISFSYEKNKNIFFGENVDLTGIFFGNKGDYKIKWLIKDHFKNTIKYNDFITSESDTVIIDENNIFRVLNVDCPLDLNLFKEETINIEELKIFYENNIKKFENAGFKFNFENSDLKILTGESYFKMYIFRLEDRFKFKLKKVYDFFEYDFEELNKYFRDSENEEEIFNFFKSNDLPLNYNGEIYITADLMAHFIENIINIIPDNLKVVLSKKINIIKKPKFYLNTKRQNTEIKAELYLDEEIFDNYFYQLKENKSHIIIKSGDIIKIPESLKDVINKIRKNKPINIVDLIEIKEEVKGEYENIFNNLSNFQNLKNYEMQNFKGELRNYQKYGYNYMRFFHENGINCILADDMGLGKTIQIIALLCNLNLENKALIVTPKSVIYNWQEEIEKFSDLTTNIFLGTDRDIEKNSQIILTTYSTLKNSLELLESEFEYVILDEAQYIKNNWTLSSKMVKKIKAKNKIALTGTPVENSIYDLLNILDFLYPGYFNKYVEFENIYTNEEKKEAFLKKIKPFILRRTKEQVLDELPEKTEKTVHIEMLPEQKEIYINYLNKYKLDIMNDKKMINYLTFLTRLRQISCHPTLLFEKFDNSSGKFEYLVELIEEVLNSSHKMIIFSQFTSMLEIIQKYLEEKNIDYRKITGKTLKRNEIVREFNENSGIKVMLLSLKAAGTGLNITSADIVVHYDPWWNPSVENQATDRAYRIGQKKNVFVYKLVSKNTVEEKILFLKEKKQELYENIVENKRILKNLSKEDIINLLE